VQTVARAFAVLEALAELDDVGVVEIARRVGLHPSTAHRLLAALIDGGYAAKDPATGRYRLGGKVLELATGSRARDARIPFADAHARVMQSAQDGSAKRAPGDVLAVDGDRLQARSAPPAGPPASSPRTFEAILEQLESAITRGALSAGDRLPSERELASNLGVSRTSVREALRVLEALGVVETRRGPEHGAVLVTEPGNAFVTIVRMLAALRHIELEEIVDFRATVEAGAARRLAEHPNAEALAALERILAAMERDDIERAEFHALDVEFHHALVRAAGNRLVNLLAGGLSSTLRRVITDVGFLEGRWSDLRPRIVTEHRALFAAIRRGDETKAADLANRHVRYWGDRVIGLAAQAVGPRAAGPEQAASMHARFDPHPPGAEQAS
jgi:GntR family transcriptional repressor for pyruvate dehydrogenase complex